MAIEKINTPFQEQLTIEHRGEAKAAVAVKLHDFVVFFMILEKKIENSFYVERVNIF